jgi:hypothetical protein
MPSSKHVQERHCMYKLNIEARSRNHCCRAKVRSFTYFQYVSVALVTQHAKRMHRIILSSVARLAPPYLFTSSHKRYVFLRGGGSYWL